jgi:hypothetical protein
MTRPTFILVTESASESWKRDASTFCFAFACMLPGWYLEMISMSVIGVVVLLYITARSALKIGNQPLSADEARAKIDEIESQWGHTS